MIRFWTAIHRTVLASALALAGVCVAESRSYDAHSCCRGGPEVVRRDGGGEVVLSSGTPDRYGFTGREKDDESGLMHYRMRAYDPRVGRFVQRDPVAPALEHAVTAAQAARTRTAASARELLADEIRILRQNTNAPNSALRDIIRQGKELHPSDYAKLGD